MMPGAILGQDAAIHNGGGGDGRGMGYADDTLVHVKMTLLEFVVFEEGHQQ